MESTFSPGWKGEEKVNAVHVGHTGRPAGETTERKRERERNRVCDIRSTT